MIIKGTIKQYLFGYPNRFTGTSRKITCFLRNTCKMYVKTLRSQYQSYMRKLLVIVSIALINFQFQIYFSWALIHLTLLFKFCMSTTAQHAWTKYSNYNLPTLILCLLTYKLFHFVSLRHHTTHFTDKLVDLYAIHIWTKAVCVSKLACSIDSGLEKESLIIRIAQYSLYSYQLALMLCSVYFTNYCQCLLQQRNGTSCDY